MSRKQQKRRAQVAAPLVISGIVGLVLGVCLFVFTRQINNALIAAGLGFIASVVLLAMLALTEKPNDEELGKGAGIKRSMGQEELKKNLKKTAEKKTSPRFTGDSGKYGANTSGKTKDSSTETTAESSDDSGAAQPGN